MKFPIIALPAAIVRSRRVVICAAVMLATACSAAPRQRPVKAGPVNEGPGTLASARTFLQGRWALESFEIRQPNTEVIRLNGNGTLIYDDSGNLRMEIRADQAAADKLRAAGIDIRDGVISTDGRTAIDLQNKTLTYVLQGQAPLIRGPLGADKPRHWQVEGDLLILTTLDEAGRPLSVGRWKRMP